MTPRPAHRPRTPNEGAAEPLLPNHRARRKAAAPKGFVRAIAVPGLVAVLIWAAIAPARAANVQDAPLETRIKAAMIYNFTRFVRWSDGVREPLVVCVFRDAEMVAAINDVSDTSGRGKRLARALPLEDPTAVHGCDALFLPNGNESVTAMALEASRRQSVLTIGDSLRFVESGGAIGFFLDRDRVRFAVSLSTLERNGITVSSRLLSLAKVVDKGNESSKR